MFIEIRFCELHSGTGRKGKGKKTLSSSTRSANYTAVTLLDNAEAFLYNLDIMHKYYSGEFRMGHEGAPPPFSPKVLGKKITLEKLKI
jgi:hypothetical protein